MAKRQAPHSAGWRRAWRPPRWRASWSFQLFSGKTTVPARLHRIRPRPIPAVFPPSRAGKNLPALAGQLPIQLIPRSAKQPTPPGLAPTRNACRPPECDSGAGSGRTIRAMRLPGFALAGQPPPAPDLLRDRSDRPARPEECCLGCRADRLEMTTSRSPSPRELSSTLATPTRPPFSPSCSTKASSQHCEVDSRRRSRITSGKMTSIPVSPPS